MRLLRFDGAHDRLELVSSKVRFRRELGHALMVSKLSKDSISQQDPFDHMQNSGDERMQIQ